MAFFTYALCQCSTFNATCTKLLIHFVCKWYWRRLATLQSCERSNYTYSWYLSRFRLYSHLDSHLVCFNLIYSRLAQLWLRADKTLDFSQMFAKYLWLLCGRVMTAPCCFSQAAASGNDFVSQSSNICGYVWGTRTCDSIIFERAIGLHWRIMLLVT